MSQLAEGKLLAGFVVLTSQHNFFPGVIVLTTVSLRTGMAWGQTPVKETLQ